MAKSFDGTKFHIDILDNHLVLLKWAGGTKYYHLKSAYLKIISKNIKTPFPKHGFFTWCRYDVGVGIACNFSLNDRLQVG